MKLNRKFSSASCCDDRGGDWCTGQCQEHDPQIQFAVQSCWFFGLFCTPGQFAWLGALNLVTACVTRTATEYRFKDEKEGLLNEVIGKKMYYHGAGEIIHIYISNILQDSGGIVGYAYYPTILNTNYSFLDGIVMDPYGLSIGEQEDFTDGWVLAHEVG